MRRISTGILVIAFTAAAIICGGRTSWVFHSPAAATVHSVEAAEAIRIEGTTQFKDQINVALQLLKAQDPEAYKIVEANIGVIKEGEHSGMRAYDEPPVFEANDRTVFYSITWCASAIAHDSMHSKLYHDYLKSHGGLVPADIWTGETAEKICLAHQTDVLKKIGAPDTEIQYCDHGTGDYWRTDYDKRNW
jgi:hypothetical protein